jgi:hypothetical protein
VALEVLLERTDGATLVRVMIVHAMRDIKPHGGCYEAHVPLTNDGGGKCKVWDCSGPYPAAFLSMCARCDGGTARECLIRVGAIRREKQGFGWGACKIF